MKKIIRILSAMGRGAAFAAADRLPSGKDRSSSGFAHPGGNSHACPRPHSHGFPFPRPHGYSRSYGHSLCGACIGAAGRGGDDAGGVLYL